MLLPKRIRLLQTCREHLYNEVKKTLATDKEIRALREMDKRVGDYYVNLCKPKKMKVFCSAGCGFKDVFETDEFGLNYFQAVGTCPNCNAPTVYKNGKPTAIVMELSVKN